MDDAKKMLSDVHDSAASLHLAQAECRLFPQRLMRRRIEPERTSVASPSQIGPAGLRPTVIPNGAEPRLLRELCVIRAYYCVPVPPEIGLPNNSLYSPLKRDSCICSIG